MRLASGVRRFGSYALNARRKTQDAGRTTQSAFTLLELLVVVSIISIALGLLTPLFRKTFLDLQLNSSAQEIVSLMRYAQERAIVENTVFRLNLDTENGSYWLTMENPDKPEGNGLASYSQSHNSDTDVFSRLAGNLGRLNNIAEGLKIETQENTVDFYLDGEAESFKIKITNPNNKGLVITQKSAAGTSIVVIDENEK